MGFQTEPLEDRISELEKRELELEAVVQAMFEVFQKLGQYGGGIVGSVMYQSGLDELFTELYNSAEVSSDIGERVKIEIEFEQEDD